jgi:hypothetical protein
MFTDKLRRQLRQLATVEQKPPVAVAFGIYIKLANDMKKLENKRINELK